MIILVNFFWDLIGHAASLVDLAIGVGALSAAWKFWLKKKFEAVITDPIAKLNTDLVSVKTSVANLSTLADDVKTLKTDVKEVKDSQTLRNETVSKIGEDVKAVAEKLTDLRSDFSDLCGRLAIDKNLPVDTLLRMMRSDIQAHECLLRCHMDAVGKIAYQMDAKGDWIWISRKFTEIVGVDFSQCRGRNWINIIHAGVKAMVVEGMDQAIEEKRDYEDTIRFKATYGKTAYEGLTRIHVLKEDDGTVLGYFGYFL